jgi:hypothetical protein
LNGTRPVNDQVFNLISERVRELPIISSVIAAMMTYANSHPGRGGG